MAARFEQTVCNHGQDFHFHGRNGAGPGSYMQTDINMPKAYRRTGNSPMGKGDRGLLTLKKEDSPGPCSYDNNTIKVKAGSHKDRFSVPKRNRENFFAKFTS
jgi:hypothetical protein